MDFVRRYVFEFPNLASDPILRASKVAFTRRGRFWRQNEKKNHFIRVTLSIWLLSLTSFILSLLGFTMNSPATPPSMSWSYFQELSAFKLTSPSVAILTVSPAIRDSTSLLTYKAKMFRKEKNIDSFSPFLYHEAADVGPSIRVVCSIPRYNDHMP